MSGTKAVQRKIPSIDQLLRSAVGMRLQELAGHELTVEAYRLASTELRATAYDSAQVIDDSVESVLNDSATLWLDKLLSPKLRSVFNLTGTVLHTNLGRAPMPDECLAAIETVARGACNLEYRIDRGKRGDRDDHVERWLCRLTGAEAATVVNNNAAAVLLTLNSLALRKSVVVSRGELVEIGGSFRMPDIMKRAGCRLLEVGTTNRTHLNDYAGAVDDGAKCIMRVHTSNFKIEGFTSEVADQALGKLARENDALFINDLGSGALVDMQRFGLPAEPTAAAAISNGAQVVTFSGDKLLGGPQCGLIIGDKKRIDRIKKNPMKRALRCDKMTLAALEAVLRLYADPDRLTERVPALRILSRSEQSIQRVAEQVVPAVAAAVGDAFSVEIRPCQSQVGSGALPVDSLPSSAIVIEPFKSSGKALDKLAYWFRALPQPVIGRISNNALWFDLRCLEEPEALIANLQTGAER